MNQVNPLGVWSAIISWRPVLAVQDSFRIISPLLLIKVAGVLHTEADCQ
jgi:hypothetical protein